MIRPATTADIPDIVEHGRRMHTDTSYAHVTYSPARVAATCATLISNGFIIVAELDGVIVGAMLGDVCQPWYTEDYTGIEHALYLQPEHRNGLLAAKMVRSFEKWCVSMGAKQIRPGVGTGVGNVERLYEALGFKRVGSFFNKDIHYEN